MQIKSDINIEALNSGSHTNSIHVWHAVLMFVFETLDAEEHSLEIH